MLSSFASITVFFFFARKDVKVTCSETSAIVVDVPLDFLIAHFAIARPVITGFALLRSID